MKSIDEVQPKSRDLRFDTLRGLFLVCMVINHMPTEIRYWTDQSLGVFSSAEGFVFLSGLLAGWVYTKKYRAGGYDALWTASANRAKTIYYWHVGSLLGAFIVVQLTEHILGYCAPTAPRLFFEHPLVSLGLGSVLLYQPGLLDLLPMYCGFVLLLPWTLRALEAGKYKQVLGLSALVWFAVQYAPPIDGAPIYPINTGSFNMLAWQVLFVAGVAIGHARISGHPQVKHPSPWILGLATVVAVYGFGLKHFQWPVAWPDNLYGVLLNKPALGLLRMTNFAAIAYLVSAFGERFPSALSFRPLAFLGRHSLVVVALQSVVITAMLQFPIAETFWSRNLSAVAVVGIIYLGAWVVERYFTPAPVGPRQPATPGVVGT